MEPTMPRFWATTRTSISSIPSSVRRASATSSCVGALVHTTHGARIEIGAQEYSSTGRSKGHPSAILSVKQLPGCNVVEAAAGVRKLMAEAKPRSPQDMEYAIGLDTNRAVSE